MNQRANLPRALDRLLGAIETNDHLSSSHIAQIVGEADLAADDLAPWADFDHPVADSYGRKLVWDFGSFEVMVMSWNPGDMAAIHDHGYTQWGAVRLFGDAEHAIFRAENDRLVTTDRRVFPSGSVVKVNNDLIHQMGNVGQEPFVSLHIYGCYERDGGITSEARLYELDEGRIQRTNGGVFFDLPEADIVRTEQGPDSDFTTRLRHRVELLRRLLTRHNSLDEGSYQSPRERALGDALFDATNWSEAAAQTDAAFGDGAGLHSKPEAVAQDLRAAARLKGKLIAAGLASGGLADRPRRLREIAGMQDPGRTVDAYLDLIDSAAVH